MKPARVHGREQKLMFHAYSRLTHACLLRALDELVVPERVPWSVPWTALPAMDYRYFEMPIPPLRQSFAIIGVLKRRRLRNLGPHTTRSTAAMIIDGRLPVDLTTASGRFDRSLGYLYGLDIDLGGAVKWQLRVHQRITQRQP